MDLIETDVIKITIATKEHLKYIHKIVHLIEKAAESKNSGIALRSYDYIKKKISERKAILAFSEDKLAGFCYIETWDYKKYIAVSGLVVESSYRGQGIAKKIKKRAFEVARVYFPDAKIFGLTTSLAVMKINSSLGYVPVTFSELTKDEQFWKGCETCKYYDILVRTQKEKCLCTGMIFNPDKS